LICESTSDLVLLLAGNRCVYANAAAREALSIDDNADPFRVIHHDDIGRMRRELLHVSPGESVFLSCRVPDRNGRWRWLEICASSASHHGAAHVLAIGRDVTERKLADERQAMHLEVSRLLGQAASIPAASTHLLEVVCSQIGYEVGELWLCDETTGMIDCVDHWHARTLRADELVAVTRNLQLHNGRGLPGNVWLSREPIWIADVASSSEFLRRPAAALAGLHTAVGCPMIHHGELLGVLVFLSRELHEPDRDVLDLLSAIGGQVAQFVARHRAEKLVEEQLRTSLREKEMFIKEIHHRVKNNLQLVISLLSIQAEQLELKDPNVASAFEEAKLRIQTMAMIHDTLCRIPGADRVELAAHIEQICAQVHRSYGTDVDRVSLELSLQHARTELDIAIPCGLIVNELVGNALKHAFPDGRRGAIYVGLEVADDQLVLVVRDTGIGLDPTFDPRASTTLGLQLVFDLTEQLEGTLEVRADDGAMFSLRIPLHHAKEVE
jgi:two-component sensor histidine kinase